jgi:predicted outer membrane repeat protein
MLCTIALILGTLLSTSTGRQATIRVPQDQPTIQQAIDAASPGDVVLVAPGTYTGPLNRNLNCHGKGIEVRGDGGAGVTIIDCQNAARGFVFFTGETNATLITGLTITHGFDGGAPEGGGAMIMLASSPTIRDCSFVENAGSGSSSNGGGGGISCHVSSAIADNCAFIDNTATGDPGGGGGLASHASALTVNRCTFTGNEAIATGGPRSEGGGMFIGTFAPVPTVTDCVFSDNRAGGGGGLFAANDLTILRSDFLGNTATDGHGGGAMINVANMAQCRFIGNVAARGGGGVELVTSSTVSQSSFIDNVAGERGGGIYCLNNPSTFTDCIIAGNQSPVGGGFSIDNTHSFVRCTIVGNSSPQGSGGHVQGVADISQSIIAFGVGGAAIACGGFSGADLSCSNLYGNQGGDWVG